MERLGYLETIMSAGSQSRDQYETFDTENVLIDLHMPMVERLSSQVWKRAGRNISREDLLSVGVYGLCQALQSYDMDSGVDFEQHCMGCIDRALADAIRYADFVRRYESQPRHFISDYSEIEMERDHGTKEYAVMSV